MPVSTTLNTSPSILVRANLHVLNDASTLVSNEVSISLDVFARLFPGSRTGSDTVSSTYVLVKFLGVPDYFPTFTIYKVSRVDFDYPHGTLKLINHSNLSHFGLNFTVSGCLVQSIDAADIPELTKVFVEVPQGIYQILSQQPASEVKSNFTSKYIVSNGGVVAQNDRIRALNGLVKLCEPFSQGRIGSSTDLVFIQGPPRQRPQLQLQLSDDFDFDVDLSQYLSKSVNFSDLQPDHVHYQLTARPLPQRIAVTVPNAPLEDRELFVFVSTSDLSKLGFPIFNGDLVTLQASNVSVVVKIFTFLEPNAFRPDSLYLSPLLLVNLDLSLAQKVSLAPVSSNTPYFSEVFPVAKSATISRVASPITMDKTYQQSFMAELRNTFHSQAKSVRAGDLVPVCIDSLLARSLFELLSGNASADENTDLPATPVGNPDSVAWFKIVEITGETNEGNASFDCTQQYIIDPSKTALISSGVEFSRLPLNSNAQWCEYLNLPPHFNYIKAFQSSPSTFKYAQEFYQILRTFISTHSKISLNTTVLLSSMTRGLGKSMLVKCMAAELGLNVIELDAFDLLRPGAELKTIGLLSGKIEKQLNGQLEAAHVDNFHILYIKHIEALCVQVDQNEQGANSSVSLALKVTQTIQELLKKYKNMAFVASCNDIEKVSDSLRLMITFQINLSVPSEEERSKIFEFLLQSEGCAKALDIMPEEFEDSVQFESKLDPLQLPFSLRTDISKQNLALKSAGLTPPDLKSIIKMAKQIALKRHIALSKKIEVPLDKLVRIGNGGTVVLDSEDFDKAINDARDQFSDSIGAPKIPNVKWEDIGGLDLVKDEILDTIDMPLKHPELFSNGLKKRSGILFYGPPGTGKTLLAKAIATNFSLNFFSVKGPELLNMYIGESEANVRRVFQKARDAKPCVIFFDELDSVAPKRGNQGDSGGVMDRIVSQLLAELDGMSGGENNGDGVFVVGATNRPDLLDEALLRPGRFDKMLYLGISDTNEKQTKILEALTRKFKLGDDVDLPKISEKCSFTFTGADFYALCSDSMLNAMTRCANTVDSKLNALNSKRKKDGLEPVSSRWWFDNVAGPEDLEVLVTMEDFKKAQNELVPSVSAEELQHYLRVKQNFEGVKERNVEADVVNGSSDGQNVGGFQIEANGH